MKHQKTLSLAWRLFTTFIAIYSIHIAVIDSMNGIGKDLVDWILIAIFIVIIIDNTIFVLKKKY